jgi:hypothetical protein
VNLQSAGDGYGTSGLSQTDVTDYRELGSFSHVPLCPNQWTDGNVFDAPFDLEVRVVDRRGLTVTRSLRVVPRCSEAGQSGDACRCLCAPTPDRALCDRVAE